MSSRSERSAHPGGWDHSGGTLLPHSGYWTGVVEGVTTDRSFYCGDLFRVTRKNIETEYVGNLEDEDDAK